MNETADCDRFLDRLSPSLDGELADAEARSVRAHVAACPECGRAMRKLERLEALSARVLRSPPAVSPIEWTAARQRSLERSARARAASARLPLQFRRERAFRRSLTTLALAAAALVAATLALPLVLGELGRRGGHEHDPATAGAPIRFNRAPGANAAQILEIGGDTDHQIDVEIPSNDGDAIVITISKL